MTDIAENPSTDRIEKSIHLSAPRSRVWRALTNAEEFGAWFGVKLDGSFVVNERTRGRILSPGYEHLTIEMDVVALEPEHRFAYRWHPYAVDPKIDYGEEAPTLVTFLLEETSSGTQLRVIESGFDAIPAHRRAEAFRMNASGWAAQLTNVERHVTG